MASGYRPRLLDDLLLLGFRTYKGHGHEYTLLRSVIEEVSINLLTLSALVVAIGTVVDNAIVVGEAVQSQFDAGYRSAYAATRDAMDEVTMAIITCTIVFMAVAVN